ncbi:major facilitator superfamily domain-containing protein [Phyllosticta citriasiana]|uniref:Major facilitator superfamily domain-containing protein n=1 Tax=Phyllosticta citriasiana TaxID=595635 RepID=A0ABR1L2M9_9PEZI
MTRQPSPNDVEKATISAPALSSDDIEMMERGTSMDKNSEDRIRSGTEPDLKERNTATVDEKDRNLVTWDSETDPDSPKNWSKKRRWIACVLLSLFNFVGPLSSAIAAPALESIAADLNTSNTVGVMILSIYMLAFSVGPLFTSPLSELYGRLAVLQICNAFFFVFNTACGFAGSSSQMLAFRFLSGIGGCAAQSIGGGILSDMFTPLERGKALAVYSIAPLLGPIIGPVAGGFLVEYVSWKWCFWIISILDVLVQVCGLVCLRETYPPVLLQRKRDALIKETGNEELRTEFDGSKDWKRLLNVNLQRPFVLLGTQPIVQVMSLYIGYVYGLAFLVSATFPMVWEGVYNESPSIASLNYMSSGIGVIIMSQVSPRLGDRIFKRLIARSPNNQSRPEFRLPLLFLAATMLPVGLLIYGWSAEKRVHWIVPNIGAAIFSASTFVTFMCVQQYLIDAYTVYAASALAASTVLRGLCGFAIPLFAPSMYKDLGFGWGNTILSGVGIVVGFPGAFMLWKWGAALRAKSQYVSKK